MALLEATSQANVSMGATLGSGGSSVPYIGYFSVVNDAVLAGNSSDPMTSGSSGIGSNSITNTGITSGATAILTVPLTETGESIPKPHCSSFEYSKPPGALYSGCGVVGVYNTLYAFTSSGYIEMTVTFLGVLYFTMPRSMPNGVAATKTAEAMERAFDVAEDGFAANPNASEMQAEIFMKEALSKEMKKIGGSVSSSVAPFDIPNSGLFVRNLFTTGNCNT